MGPWKRLWSPDAALPGRLAGHSCQDPDPRLALCQPEVLLLTDKSSTVHGSKPSHGFVLLCFKLATGEGVVSLGVEGEQNPDMLGCIPAVSCITWVFNEATGVLGPSKAQQGSPSAHVLEMGVGLQSCQSASSDLVRNPQISLLIVPQGLNRVALRPLACSEHKG